MMVLKSTYEKLECQHLVALAENVLLRNKHAALMKKWNGLVDLINEKGGQQFLDSGSDKISFSQDEVKKLLTLCHPDKHGSSEIAHEITLKILAMRK